MAYQGSKMDQETFLQLAEDVKQVFVQKVKIVLKKRN